MNEAINTLLKQRRDRYKKQKKLNSQRGEECLFFQRGSMTLGIPLTDLKEIKRMTDGWTQIPGISQVIKGVTSVSGRITAIHDLAAFHQESESAGAIRYLIVSEFDDYGWMGLACDEVQRIEQINRDLLVPLPLHMEEYQDCYLGMTDSDRLIINIDGLIQNQTFFKA
jgi:chemotaxis signal transduction protein